MGSDSHCHALFWPSLSLRAVLKDNEPWFIAADVCKALGIINVTPALNNVAADDKGTFNVGLPGRAPWLVNESGLYDLIFQSRKPEAKTFKKWVTSEVLPAIRKNGLSFTFRPDGWFNMTKAAKHFGKRLDNFLALPSTLEYVEALALSLKISDKELVQAKRGNGNLPTVGTWAHPKLAVFFARWLDVRFAVWCDAALWGTVAGLGFCHLCNYPASGTIAMYLIAWNAITETSIGVFIFSWRSKTGVTPRHHSGLHNLKE